MNSTATESFHFASPSTLSTSTSVVYSLINTIFELLREATPNRLSISSTHNEAHVDASPSLSSSVHSLSSSSTTALPPSLSLPSSQAITETTEPASHDEALTSVSSQKRAKCDESREHSAHVKASNDNKQEQDLNGDVNSEAVEGGVEDQSLVRENKILKAERTRLEEENKAKDAEIAKLKALLAQVNIPHREMHGCPHALSGAQHPSVESKHASQQSQLQGDLPQDNQTLVDAIKAYTVLTSMTNPTEYLENQQARRSTRTTINNKMSRAAHFGLLNANAGGDDDDDNTLFGGGLE